MREQSPDHVNHQAREWFVTLQSGAVSAAQREAFARWYATPLHARAYAEYEQVWASLGELADTEQGRQLHRSVQPARWRRQLAAWWQQWQLLGYGMAGTAIASLLVVALLLVPSAPVVTTYQTAKAEQQDIVLADGSRVTLAAKSRLRVWHSDSGRFVELLSGVAFFDVAKDAARPFYVQAADVRVQVVGTQFDVQRQAHNVKVSVREGRVQVAEVAQSLMDDSQLAVPPQVTLAEGEAVARLPGLALQSVPQVQAAGDWRQGQLLYRNAPLAEVVADANRYFDGEIVIGSTALQHSRVTLALRTDQVADFPNMLAQSLPVTVYREPGNRIVIIAKSTTQQ